MASRARHIVQVAAVLWIAAGRQALAQDELFVANSFFAHSVTAYARTANGDIAPVRTIHGPSTGLDVPTGLAVDLAHEELVITNSSANSVTVYSRTATGDAVPLRTIFGDATGLDWPIDVVVDLLHDEILVANYDAFSITVYDRTATGNAAPIRTIVGPATNLDFAFGLALDSAHDEIVVAGGIFPGAIMVFPRLANGDVAPLRTLAGPAVRPSDVAVDIRHDELILTNFFTNSIGVYPRTADGDVAPLRTIVGSSTGLNGPSGILLDPVNDELIVANVSGSSVTTYPRSGQGNISPMRTLAGPSTGLQSTYFAGITNGAAGEVPDAIAVDSVGNRVLEPNEAVSIAPRWRNAGDGSLTLSGTFSDFSGPPGPTYTITDSTGDYGTISPGAAADCLDCFEIEVTAGTRPGTHWDSAVTETLTPTGSVRIWPLHIGESFTDVPSSSPFYRFVETILHRGVTAGCGGGNFCPSAPTTREQMPVLVLTANEGLGYAPPPCAVSFFADVPITSPFCPWILELARRNVVAGCGVGMYCPGDPVTREQMSVFTLAALEGVGYAPPPCAVPLFSDVPASNSFCPWIEELARRGVIAGCGGGNYCPSSAVLREQMGVFLGVSFGLTLYDP